jgi:CheY-like chemotaxis protein
MIAPTRTALLVEDEPDDVLLARRAWEVGALPASLQVVEDGDAALAYLGGTGVYADRRLHPLPHYVLLDLKLPRRSGLEVLQWTRAQPALRYMPIIVFTSSYQTSDIERAYTLGANSYLVKPVGFQALLDLLRQVDQYWGGLNQGRR